METPFGWASDAIVEGEWAGVPVLMLARHGVGHVLNPTQVPYRANIFAMKQLGCTHILASGAVGSLREELRPRDLVIPDQVIDRTSRRAGTFYENGAVHVEFAEPFCPVLRRFMMRQDGGGGVTAIGGRSQPPPNPEPEPPKPAPPAGRYVAMDGPAFSTRAESLMHRAWGGDLIGMTAMPEAKLAREAEIPYALIALVTDYDCWRPASATGENLLSEIIGNLKAGTESAMALIKKTVERMGRERELLETCPALSALKLAIWFDKTRISADEVRRLAPLWGKYFG